MWSSIAFWSGKKWARAGTERVCSVPAFVFIKSCDSSIKSFSEIFKFGKVNVNPLTVNPIVIEYLFR